MTTIRIRVTMRNNSDARRADVLGEIPSAQARHNGGKVVVVTLDESDLETAREILNASSAVTEFDLIAG